MSELNETLPAISVIIPVYNAEKYIQQCLSSILIQTFQDYEVIVVDDCSTDDSIKIIELMMPIFKDKLKLIKRSKNSGSPAIPRNIGMRCSRGKYISFIDNDDVFTSNALKDMYDSAEQTQADVIHAERFLTNKGSSEELDKNSKLILTHWESGSSVNKITFETDDIEERVKLFCKRRLFWNVWNKLFRRDFIVENYIEFPEIQMVDDLIFCFYCVCLAKKYVRIPNVFNIYRNRNDSAIRKKSDSIKEHIHKWLNILIEGVNYLNEFMNSNDIFIKNPQLKSRVLDFYILGNFDDRMKPIYLRNPSHVIDKILIEEFSAIPYINSEIITYLFSKANTYKIILDKQKKQIEELQNQLNELKK